MHKDEIQGKAKVLEGKIEEKIGHLTDNPKQEIKGLQKQVEGHTQEAEGKVKNALHKAID